jgi:hypothetical protein
MKINFIQYFLLSVHDITIISNNLRKYMIKKMWLKCNQIFCKIDVGKFLNHVININFNQNKNLHINIKP